MDDKSKHFPEIPKQIGDIQPFKFKLAGSKLGRLGLGTEPSIITDNPSLTTGQGVPEAVDGVQPPDESFGTVASDYESNMDELFNKEHSLRERPKPVTTSTSRYNHFAQTTTTPTTTTSLWTEERAQRPKPTIDERIQTAEEISKQERAFERELSKRSRTRHNFDTDFHIAAKYAIKPSTYGHYSFDSREAYETVFEQLTSNRKILYGYLQHLGMCVVDDTGRDVLYGDRMDAGNRGFLMLPKEIEHSDYFSFEDEIRDHFPFTIDELKVKLLKAKKENPTATIEAVIIQSTPEQMRELVDSLALDDRFTHLFEKAEVIRAARKEKPRAEGSDDVQNEEVEPELPTFDPAHNKKSKWR